ncbi:MAG: dihydropteroate synthase [Bacteroidetes bacterium]|nr:dihydropteroate synthase [Bacteroidota bacterium]
MTSDVRRKPAFLNCAGRILDLGKPVVMGILNVTPDSFYDGGSYPTVADQLKKVEKMLQEGASIIDIGAVSTRPGSKPVDIMGEINRLLPVLSVITKYFPSCIISVDTFRLEVAMMAIDQGVGMINDIYAGRFDPAIMDFAASSKVPYIMMHMQGTPVNMQAEPHYSDIVAEIIVFFRERLKEIPGGLSQVIIDPGFGFGKTVDHNYEILRRFTEFQQLGYPVMAGLSRKSMINKALHIKPQEALNATTVLNTVALLKGADILRVHDVKEAVEAVKLVEMLN